MVTLGSYRPLKDLVYDYISRKIAQDELSVGDRVPEPMICEALGVSRTPVREALIQLASEGYLENIPRRGFRVRGISDESARELYEIIGPLDGHAAALACPHLTPDDLHHMQFLWDSMNLAINSHMFERYDGFQKEFHRIYQQRCGNKRLLKLLEAQDRAFMKPGYGELNSEAIYELLAKANREHAHILELFQAGAAAEVENYIRDVHWSTENARYNAW
ncbi:GntR family transcriptional regulator [Collinsella sp. zg1085]|nr:GntR family transcriptional regulator [Collinsella sp. zg1085]